MMNNEPTTHTFIIGWWEYRINSYGFDFGDIVDVHVKAVNGRKWLRVTSPHREEVIKEWLAYSARKKASLS